MNFHPFNALLAGNILVVALLLPACSSISFSPPLSAQIAVDKIIDEIRGEPMPQVVPVAAVVAKAASAEGATAEDFVVGSQAVTVIKRSLAQRYLLLKPHFDAGAVGVDGYGMLAVRDFGLIAEQARADIIALVADDNKDRGTLCREIGRANGHPDWVAELRATFAQRWISRAQSGWYYRDSVGVWTRKP